MLHGQETKLNQTYLDNYNWTVQHWLKLFQFLVCLFNRTGILKQQLAHYKDIIRLRVPDCQPVITYQDNMQLKRTSLRHLRLSKLQKEKVKQGKMWDFTVRGYRATSTEDIEDLFEDAATAVLPQRDVRQLTYDDTKLGKIITGFEFKKIIISFKGIRRRKRAN